MICHAIWVLRSATSDFIARKENELKQRLSPFLIDDFLPFILEVINYFCKPFDWPQTSIHSLFSAIHLSECIQVEFYDIDKTTSVKYCLFCRWIYVWNQMHWDTKLTFYPSHRPEKWKYKHKKMNHTIQTIKYKAIKDITSTLRMSSEDLWVSWVAPRTCPFVTCKTNYSHK